MATVATTTPILILATTTPIIIATATLTTTPATTGTPAPWYRAALILPIAPSVTSPTTRRPGRISAAMVCGILAHNGKKRAAQNRSLFMVDTFTFILAARSVELIARHLVTRELHAALC